MATDADPVLGMWYKHFDKGEKFEVIAVDDDARLVEIQYYDGDIDEVDFQTWYQLPIAPIEAPEDETAPLDRVDADDLGYSETSPPEPWELAAEGVKNPKEAWDRMTGAYDPDAAEAPDESEPTEEE